ncbi:Uncharacterised protein [Yersinia pseudotuberculosis]|uniref:Uncharacterized protein n=1 Tax=Yersinia pseudotuberculosis TaxID=633 RepID=A0A380QFH3_YERPU|nr:Uncharacterised protein [Yersinia pseudotuberculosis]
MVKDNFVNDVRSKAKGHWDAIFQRLDTGLSTLQTTSNRP